MAQSIPFTVPPPDRRAELQDRLERAPAQHAEALLAAYGLLQALHDRGMLDFARTAVAASDELVAQAVDTANTPEAVRALRNLMFLLGMLGTAERQEPVRVWSLLRRAFSRDSLRGLAAGVDLLERFGRHLRQLETSTPASRTQS